MINSKRHIIPIDLSLKRIITKINTLKIKLLIVCNRKKKFIGTISDGDIRRFIIKKNFKNFSNFQAKDLINKNSYIVDNNLNSNKEIPNNIFYLPVIDKNKKFIRLIKNDIKIIHTKRNETRLKNRVAIVLAGGEGRRLRPITKKIPKPLVLVKNKPNLLRIINLLERHRFEEIIICARYKFNMIKKFLKNFDFKAKIFLHNEKKPLGTAGPIGNLKLSQKNYLILNSDLVFDVDLDDLYNFHKKRNSHLTVCVKQKEYQIPYGVIEVKKNFLNKINEKPDYNFLFNAGIYLINKNILKTIKKEKFLSMVDFINNQIKKKIRPKIYFLHENWIDIGNIQDLEKANKF